MRSFHPGSTIQAIGFCDRTRGRADSSGKHRRHGVNLQVVNPPDGTLVWISPAMPGRTHDLTAARRHPVIATCIRLGIPILADCGYQGAGDIAAVPYRRPPNKDPRSNKGAPTGHTLGSDDRSRQPSRRSRPGGSSAKPAAAPP
ncbi:transposase family protein [Streptomyces chartreusis]|uniref:transposase family protein n=1 Tax=Streptomyces chartreusis TaxID=1969 RepID=UPI003817EABB